MEINYSTGQLVNASIKVRSVWGLVYLNQLMKKYYFNFPGGLNVSEFPIAVYYDHLKVDVRFKADLLVEDIVIVEIKSAMIPLLNNYSKTII